MRLAPQETRTYFITAVTAQRRRLFQVTRNAELLLQTIQHYRSQGKFLLHAYVIMPDHFHLILTPAPDVSLERAVQFIKGGFSFRLQSKTEVWMRSFNESQISRRKKFEDCLRYIEENPVRRGLASQPSAYPHSSANYPCDPRRFISTAIESAAKAAWLLRMISFCLRGLKAPAPSAIKNRILLLRRRLLELWKTGFPYTSSEKNHFDRRPEQPRSLESKPHARPTAIRDPLPLNSLHGLSGIPRQHGNSHASA